MFRVLADRCTLMATCRLGRAESLTRYERLVYFFTETKLLLYGRIGLKVKLDPITLFAVHYDPQFVRAAIDD